MTREQFNNLLQYLDKNYPDLKGKFPNLIFENNGFGIFKPAKVSDEDYNEILEITNNWRQENNAD